MIKASTKYPGLTVTLILVLVFVNQLTTKIFAQESLSRNTFQKCDFSQAFSYGATLVLSNICTDIEYVRLETRPDLTIEQADFVCIGEKIITLADTKKGEVYLFSRSGKFARKLGGPGKLPGEYSSLKNLTLSFNESWVAVFDNLGGKVILYATGNDGFKEIPVGEGVSEVVFGPGNLLLVSYTYPVSLVNGYHQFLWIDIANGTKKSFARVPESVRRWGSMTVPIHRQKFDLVMDQLYNDTVYSIKPEGYIEPRMYFNVGKTRMPPESYGTRELYLKNTARFVRCGPWIQSGHWIFMNAWHGSQSKHIIYSIDKDSAYFVVGRNGSLLNDIQNNIDGGPNFWFDGLTVSGNPFRIVNSKEILSPKQIGTQNSLYVRDPAAAKVFRKIVAETKESDNPVLMIVTLKNTP